MATRVRSIAQRQQTTAFVLRRTPIGDADLMLALLTRSRGLCSVAARGARRQASKLGALEPIHTLLVTMEHRPEAEIGKLVESRIDRARIRLVEDEARLDAGFRMLSWVRSVAHPHEAEPRVFDLIEATLDALDRPAGAEGPSPRSITAVAGLRLLDALGYGLGFDACVACGTPCPPNASGTVDPARGGLICRSCGGGTIFVPAALRVELARAVDDEPLDLDDDDARVAMAIVEEAISSHVVGPTKQKKRGASQR